MRFRLTYYQTKLNNKYEAENRFEYLGDAKSIWELWYLLTKNMDDQHVEIFSLNGIKQQPHIGISGLQDYTL